MRTLFLMVLSLWGGMLCGQTTTTRFYLPTVGSPGINPALSNNWTQTEGYVLRPLSATKTGTSLSQLTLAVPNAINTTTLFANYVSPPLAAQTINCSVAGQVAWRVSSATGIVIYTYVVINIINSSGSIKATLLPPASGVADMGAGAYSLKTPAIQNLANYICEDGDRISIEFGTLRTSGTNTRTASMNMGDVSSNDQAVGDFGSASANPWIEFSQALIFYNGPVARPRRVTIIQ